MSTLLSEACKNGDVEAVLGCVMKLCPERLCALATVVEEDQECDEADFCAAVNISYEAHRVARHSFNSVWSYSDGDGRTALHWAVAMQNYSLAEKLMCSPYHALVDSVDHDGLSPFTTACMVGAPVELLRVVLSNAADQRRWQVARQAFMASGAAEGTEGVVGEALEECRIAVINQSDNNGNTPLLHAASRGRLPVVSFLLQLGAPIGHTNKRGQSALHRASSRGSLDVVEELVGASRKLHSEAEHRRWVNIQDYRGDTALFYASMDDNEELGRYLLRQGADRNVRNKEGKEFWEV